MLSEKYPQYQNKFLKTNTFIVRKIDEILSKEKKKENLLSLQMKDL